MKRIDSDELKKIQLEILDVVARFCEKNSIKYWLDSGTLIGAVRHKGYIPWDDDIDLGMLRPDYDKFMKLFNAQNDRYKAYSIENNGKFLYPFIKILDTQTLLYEPNEKEGIKSSVNIDLFVYDNAPDNEKKLKKMYRKRDLYQKLHNIRTRVYMSKSSKLKHFVKELAYPFLLIFPRNYFVKKLIKNSLRYADRQTERVGNFTAFVKIAADKKLFDEFTVVEFEGKNYPAPAAFDEWLRLLYGDYMQLPPEEKRVAHHSFAAYFLTDG